MIEPKILTPDNTNLMKVKREAWDSSLAFHVVFDQQLEWLQSRQEIYYIQDAPTCPDISQACL